MKLRNKLILSCAALAAVATTAVSTTYAWYTSNQEVTADSIYASTSSNSDALLLISTTGAANSWSSKVSLNLDADLVPVYKDENGAMKVWAPDTNTATTNAAAGTYLNFSLYFKSGNGNALKVRYKNFDLFNITELSNNSLPTKSVLTNEGLPANATLNGVYTVDILKALTMENEFGLVSEGDAGTTSQPFTADETSTYAFKFENLSTVTDTVTNKPVNAHEYYNDVKSLNYKRATEFTANTTYYTKSDDTYTLVEGNDTFNEDAKYCTFTAGKYTMITLASADFAAAKADGNLYVYTAGTYTQAETQPTSETFANGIYYQEAAIATDYDGSIAYRTEGSDTRLAATTANLNGDTSFNVNGYAIGGEDNDILRVDYWIYLDGWDFHCFDACQSQNISLALTFESTSVQQG